MFDNDEEISNLEKDLDVSQDMPRPDLTEKAFQRYEPFIARGLSGSYNVDVSTLTSQDGFKRGIKPITFCARFADACLAYRKYGYASSMIPSDADVHDVYAKPQKDGTVRIYNRKQDRLAQTESRRLHARNKDLVLRLANDINDQRVKGNRSDSYYIGYDTPEELAWLLSLEDQLSELVVKEKPGKMVLMF